MRPRPLDRTQKRPASVAKICELELVIRIPILLPCPNLVAFSAMSFPTNKQNKQTNNTPNVHLVTLIFFFCFLGDQMQIGNEAEATR